MAKTRLQDPEAVALTWLAELNEREKRKVFYHRELTPEEWHKVRRLVREFELPCYIEEQQFHSVLFIYEHTHVPLIKPGVLLRLEAGDLRFLAEETRDVWVAAAPEFLALTHTPRNVEILNWYGCFRSMREREYYLKSY